MSWGLALAERGLLPDPLVRAGIRNLLRDRLAAERAGRDRRRPALLRAMREGPVAAVPDRANAQHYEVPARFFEMILGPRLKYSCALWNDPGADLARAEEAMLRLTAERAGIEDGMEVLELGCGWGSLCLWLAETRPACRITAVTNSAAQKAFIDGRARERGLSSRLQVIRADMNGFAAPGRYDRVVSVEMFEHMRNYEELLARVAGWLRPGGALFLHVFAHRELAYPFETGERGDWMARHFFSGGLMPSEDLFDAFDRDLRVTERWAVSGQHYARTLRAWLGRLDARRPEVDALFRRVYGPGEARRRAERWRIFLMACEELFAWRGGEEWRVAHFLLEPVG